MGQRKESHSVGTEESVWDLRRKVLEVAEGSLPVEGIVSKAVKR